MFGSLFPLQRSQAPPKALWHFTGPMAGSAAYNIFWQVVAPLQVRPRSLALKRSESDMPQTIVVSSFDQSPFRITKVGPKPLVTKVEFSLESRQAHTLKLHFDLASVLAEKYPTVTIETDRADEPAVTLHIFTISTEG